MPKVLWVIHGAEVYGENRAICSLMRGVRDHGWDLEALSLTRGECFQQLLADGFSITCLDFDETPSMHLARHRLGRLWEFFRLAGHQFPVRRRVLAELRRRKPDVVHVFSKNLLPGVGAAAKSAHIPCFWEMTAVIGGGFAFDANRRIYRLLLNRLRIRPLANSHYTASTLGELRLPVEVMHLGADTHQFGAPHEFAVTRATLGIPAHARVYLLVSRIHPSKGQETFLRAARLVNDPRLYTVLVGAASVPEDEAHFAALKQSLSPEEAARVHFAGYSPTPEAYVALADVGVNARIDPEPFGLSVVEAMMMGKPMLVHALGGPAETVVDGVTGWHVKEPTVEGFAEGIRRTLDEFPRWPNMGAAAREHALKHFSLQRQTERYCEIVLKVLAGSSKTP